MTKLKLLRDETNEIMTESDLIKYLEIGPAPSNLINAIRTLNDVITLTNELIDVVNKSIIIIDKQNQNIKELEGEIKKLRDDYESRINKLEIDHVTRDLKF
jgi:peptidoglycan hydrolase CwlO-like protein